jgi:hypothetical protein
VGSDPSPSVRAPALALTLGVGVAVASVPLAALAGEPYLSSDHVNFWVVTYAAGTFAALFATPFALHRGFGGLLEADTRWERALLMWGAISAGVLALGLLMGVPSGFDSDSLPGSLGLVTAAEAVLVLGTLLVWLLSG